MDLALHALNRFGLGARIGEKRGLTDPRDWLLAQLDLPATSLRVEAADTTEAADALRELRAARASADGAAAARARRRLVAIRTADMDEVLTRRLVSDTPLLERLTAFWSNHLCISVRGKALMGPLAGSYEREAIRPHVLGKFEQMVLASASHPAMLLYLDNAQSVGPSSRAARSQRAPSGARRGLNENYARELLELHTLGVDGGYTQQDVQELARMLTGWTVLGLPGARRGSARGPLRFEFEPLLHEPGTKTVLGATYAEAGQAEGMEVVRALCRHPSTARFVAAKLVRHFIADTPPPAAVAAVARVFTDTDGDLRATTRALVERAEAWSAEHRKFRTPQDWLIAVLRAFGADRAAGNLAMLLQQLRHPLWAPAAPNGFADSTQDWADPDSLLNRAELARTIARRVPPRFDPATLLDVIEAPAADPLRDMLVDTTVPAGERIALAIASPAFQWR